MNLDEMKKKLSELLGDIAAKSSLGDKLTEDDTEQLEKWNKEAHSLKARIEAEKLSAEHQEEEKQRIENEKKAAVKAALQEQEEKHKAASGRLPFGDAPYAAKYSDTYKYDQLDGTELSLLIETANKIGAPVQAGAMKAMSLRVSELDAKDAGNDEEARKSVAYVKNAFKAETGILPEKEQVEAAIKADTAPMYTGASPMSDWVGTFYAQNIWQKIRGAVNVASRIPSRVVPDGFSSAVLPLESTDPSFYKVSESSATDGTLRVPDATIDASQAATGSKTVSLNKMGSRVLYSGEADEDSLIAFVPQLRSQLEAKGAEQFEHVIVDGDVETSASKNINDIAGTPAGNETFLMFDGFRKLPLVTNTGNSRSASGGFVIEDFLNTLKLLGTAGVAGMDPRQTAFIVDYNTYWAALNIPELKTKDVSNTATVEGGVLKSVYGRDVLPSFQMHLLGPTSYERKANTAGKIDLDTAGNNTTGSILAVNFSQWVLAYKRRMTMEVARLARSDSWEIVSLMRFGLAYRDTEASAISYNVGV